MLRYSSRNTNNIFTQSIVELCEACGQQTETVHISEVMSKPAHLASILIETKDVNNNDYTLKIKRDRHKEVQSTRMAAGMVSASGGTTESLKYGLRSERMCSSSNGTSTEYCYRVVDNAATESFKRAPRAKEFKVLYERRFRDKPREEAEGVKIGMDRKGNPIRIQSESFQKIDPNGEQITEVRYFGAHKREWYRELDTSTKRLTITSSLRKSESIKIEDYKFKESFELNTTASYYTNDNSVVFDGTNDYVRLTKTSGKGGLHYTKEEFDTHGVTISAWIYVESSKSIEHPILAIGRNQNEYFGYGMRITSDFRLAMDYYGLHKGRPGVTSNHVMTCMQSNEVAPTRLYKNTWMHVACVYTTSTAKNWNLYLNGKQLQSTVISGNEKVTLTYQGDDGNIGRLGKKDMKQESWLKGIINHVGIWKTALSAKSIAGIYNDGSPPNLLSNSAGYIETGSNQLRGYWAMDERKGTSLRNTGGYELAQGTLINGPEWSTDSPLIE